MRSPITRLGLSTGLLVIVVLLIGIALAALGSAVFLPQGQGVLLLGAGLAVFLAVQLLVFRILGLRSRADDEAAAAEDAEEDREWRAWRG